MKAVVATFNQEKALVGAFSVITNLRMDLFEELVGEVLVRPLAETAATDWNYEAAGTHYSIQQYRARIQTSDNQHVIPNSQFP